MEFCLPQCNFQNLIKFIDDINKCEITDKDIFVFNGSKMNNFEPFTMLVMGNIIRSFRAKHSNIRFQLIESKNSYAGNMGFYKYISPKLKYGKDIGEAAGSSNYIPITHITIDELCKKEYENCNYIPEGEIIENESKRLAQIISRNNSELHELLSYLIREMIRNIPEHAGTNDVWICGQCWPGSGEAEIAIVDNGIGIYNSLTKNKVHKNSVTNNREALELSVKPGISRTFDPGKTNKDKNNDWANSGFGLFMVSEICKLLNGSFCIISYDNYINVDNEGVTFGDTFYKGTAIRIRISINNINNARNIISTVLKKGQIEAKNIRNAFKHASKPSKGLMSN